MRISLIQYKDTMLPSVFVTNDLPAQSILGSQFTGWHLSLDGFVGDVSGPGRAMAKISDDIYCNFLNETESNIAVLLLETDKKPQEATVRQIAEKCGVTPESLFLVAFSMSSVTGSVQACARVVEAGLVRLAQVGLDPLLVRHAWGHAPLIAFVSNPAEVVERVKASIRFGGVASYIVDSQDEHLGALAGKAHDSAFKMFQEAKKLAEQNPLYKELLQESGSEMSKIDPNAVAPAEVIINSLKTGRCFSSGKADFEALKRAIGTV